MDLSNLNAPKPNKKNAKRIGRGQGSGYGGHTVGKGHNGQRSRSGFKEKFWLGGMFRVGDSYGLLTQFNVTDKILIGYSYDLTISDLNAFSNGTHEIMFRYNLDSHSR